MKKYLYILMNAVLMVMSAGCSSDEIDPKLCHEWQLSGYGSDQDFHVHDGQYNWINTRITFHSDGTYNSRANNNIGSGKYVCKENQLLLTDYCATKVATDNPTDWFIEETLFHNRTVFRDYIVSGSELRIYYDKDQYFKFNIK